MISNRAIQPFGDVAIRVFTSAAAVLLVGCSGEKNEFVAPPPPEAEVQKPLVQNQTVYAEFPGQTQAHEMVEIRARVKGFLEEISFKPGQFVDAGQPLFKIEQEQFTAAVTTAEGNLAKAEADLEIADVNYKKRDAAFKKNQAVAEIDVLAALAEKKSAEAAVEIAKAALADAKRDLTYTVISTPIAGRVSKNMVDVGNLVGASETTLLTTVVKDSPIFVEFEVNERDVLGKLENRPSSAEPDLGKEVKHLDLKLTLSDRSEYPVAGRFNFIDNTVNPKTGTIKVRAEFPNEDGALAAGLFARVGIPEEFENAILIPSSAIQRDIGGSFVMVADNDNKAVRRAVKTTGFVLGELQIIESGLTGEDRVIVSNLQRIRAGNPITPKEIPPPSPPELPEGSETPKESPADLEKESTPTPGSTPGADPTSPPDAPSNPESVPSEEAEPDSAN